MAPLVGEPAQVRQLASHRSARWHQFSQRPKAQQQASASLLSQTKWLVNTFLLREPVRLVGQ